MKRIQVLDPRVAERIAAGEVIERPASVVKELVENSIDARATEISILLEEGGKNLIEITDNGYGIHPDDLTVALKRHATSKLSSLDDLERIASLGFRGEALPSIAAVADLNILSRTPQSDTAFEVSVHNLDASNAPKAVTFGHFLNTSHGTRIQARGLFAHVPARLKFLKSQSSEVAQVREWIERLALAHPSIGFRLTSNDRTLLQLRPASETDRTRAILSDGGDYPVLTASNELSLRDRTFGTGSLQVRVHWLQGLSCPQTRKLIQVVNGRAVRDRQLQHALLSPFKQSLLPGQFPAAILYIDIDPSQIDVNVHPTKTEVRFLDSRRVFSEVHRVVEQLIAQHGAPAYAQSLTSAWGGGTPPWTASEPMPTTNGSLFKAAPTWEIPARGVAATDSPKTANPLSGGRFAGIIFNTYILIEMGEEMVLIDQHAAHERIRYERLRARAIGRGATGSSQSLLLPEAASFSPERRPELERRLPWLAQLGFECELFGEDSVLFRSVPGEWGTHELRTRLKNLVERVLGMEKPASSSSMLMDETLFEKLASEACHSAIRAGDRLEPIEAERLQSELFDCEHPWNCPHGRPTVVRVPRGKFEEWFLRRV